MYKRGIPRCPAKCYARRNLLFVFVVNWTQLLNLCLRKIYSVSNKLIDFYYYHFCARNLPPCKGVLEMKHRGYPLLYMKFIWKYCPNHRLSLVFGKRLGRTPTVCMLYFGSRIVINYSNSVYLICDVTVSCGTYRGVITRLFSNA